jgi:hypothetical protein
LVRTSGSWADAQPPPPAGGPNPRASNATTEASLIAAAGRAGIALDGLVTGGYYETAGRPGVLIGYAAAPEQRFRPGLEALAEVLASAPGPAPAGPQPA